MCVTSTGAPGTVQGMGDLAVSVIMGLMILAGVAVIVYVLRNRLEEPDLASERSAETSRAEAQAQANHSNMGPM